MQFTGVDIQLIYVTMDFNEVDVRSSYVDMLNTVNNVQRSFATMRNDFVHFELFITKWNLLKSPWMILLWVWYTVYLCRHTKTVIDMQLRFVTMRNDYIDVQLVRIDKQLTYVTINGNEGDMYCIVYLCWHANTATNMQHSSVNMRYNLCRHAT